MDTIEQAKITKAGNEQRIAIIDLLQSAKLPFEDLPASLENFFVAIENNKVVGAAGLEKYGSSGLLRSLVVGREYRDRKIASKLAEALEHHATTLGISCIYLLTETAPQYFEKKGYKRISRDLVPGELQTSSEFSHVCPVSAIVMHKAV